MMKLISTLLALCLFVSNSSAASRTPLTITPLTTPKLLLPLNSAVKVRYKLTNQSNNQYMFAMNPIEGITQLPSPLAGCGNPIKLPGHASCIITLLVNGAKFTALPTSDIPIFCQNGSKFACYRPALKDRLQITQTAATTKATLTTDAPLTLITNGDPGTLTVTNTSLDIAATNIIGDLTGTALEGHVTEESDTCSSLSPQASCTLTYLPGSTVVALTDFTIEGDDASPITASMQVNQELAITSISPSSGPASGGTGVTIHGVGLTDASSIRFGDITTTVHAIDAQTVAAVAPSQAEGAVDVVVTTPLGDAIAEKGYTYLTTAVGQPAFGGTIACLNEAEQNYLIAAVSDNSASIKWGGFGTTTFVVSTTDGATNTATIIEIVGDNGGEPYAAQLCADYEVDSQGNTPCQSGNTCYTDWFLPAGNNQTASGQLYCLHNNRDAIGGFFTDKPYWSSTEASYVEAWIQWINSSNPGISIKDFPQRVRCVRSFTP